VAELLARIRALLRRSPVAYAPKIRVGDLELDGATRTATRAGRHIVLTAKEYAVLDGLARNAEIVVSSSDLIDHAWDTNDDDVSNVVQTCIRCLRKKLTAGGEPDMIETLRGSGHRLTATP
jgi:DNA-binding response OmpR family regulator